MGPLEINLLEAWPAEVCVGVGRCCRTWPAPGVAPLRVFYDWAIFGRPEELVAVGDWEARFHGLECARATGTTAGCCATTSAPAGTWMP